MKKFQIKQLYPYFLANLPVSTINSTIPVTDKFLLKKIANVSYADSTNIEKAITIAYNSQKKVFNLPAWKRKTILLKIAESISNRTEELANILCIEAGKTINDSYSEIDRCIETFRLAAEESTRIRGHYDSLDSSHKNEHYQSITKRFPIGIVSMISPFNFPLNLVAHKIAPALACGCPFILKPSSKTPISALIIGEIMSKINEIPEGAFSILPCSSKNASLLVTDERIKMLSFTGSAEVGWDLKNKAGKKKVVLELGGNAACIIDETCSIKDLDSIINRIAFGAFYQSGQSCISVQRCLVHEKLYAKFKEKLVAVTKALKIGDPKLKSTFIGPMISSQEAKRCRDWVDEAVKNGAKILTGGKLNGIFYEPTVVENVARGMKIRDSEIFGPVVVLESFDSFKSAIDKVNDSKYGLQAGVFTNDLNRAWYSFNEIEVGCTVINDVPSKRIESMPYGGVKCSGLGREGVEFAIEEMTEPRLMLLHKAGNALVN